MPQLAAAIPAALMAGGAAVATGVMTGATLAAIATSAAYAIGVSLAIGTAMNMLVGGQDSVGQLSGRGAANTQPLKIRAGQDNQEQRVWGYGTVTSGGTEKFRQTTGADNKTLWRVYVFHDTPIDSVLNFYCNGKVEAFSGSDSTGAFAGVMSRYDQLGSLTQVAEANLVAASGGTWGSTHRLLGMAYYVWKLTYDQDKYAQGIPEPMIEFKARKLWDPRKDTAYGGVGSHTLANEATWEWSENASLCLLDYVKGVKLNGVLIGGMKVPVSGLDFDTIVASATVCDENVNLKAGGTEKRYTLNGIVGSLEDKQSVFSAMLQAMAAVPVVRNGKLGWVAGAAISATTTLTDDDVIGGITVRPSRSFQDKHNTITGVYYDRLSESGTGDVTPLTYAGFVAEDGGITLEREIRHRFTASRATAQRINKIMLSNEREQLHIEAAFKPKAAIIPLYGTFLWTSVEAGYTAQKMRLMDRKRQPDGSFMILARQETDAKYAWAQSTEEIDPPSFFPHASFDPAYVPPPTIGSITLLASSAIGTGGALVPSIRIQVATPTNTFVREILVEWQQSGSLEWTSAAPIIPDYTAPFSYGVITGLAPGAHYKVRIAYRTDNGVSGWTELSEVIATGSSSPDLYVQNLVRSIETFLDRLAEIDITLQNKTEIVLPAAVDTLRAEATAQSILVAGSVATEATLRASSDSVLGTLIDTVAVQAGDAWGEGKFRIVAGAAPAGAVAAIDAEVSADDGVSFESASWQLAALTGGGSLFKVKADLMEFAATTFINMSASSILISAGNFNVDGTFLINGALLTTMLATNAASIPGSVTWTGTLSAPAVWSLIASFTENFLSGRPLSIVTGIEFDNTDSGDHTYEVAVTRDSTNPLSGTPPYRSGGTHLAFKSPAITIFAFPVPDTPTGTHTYRIYFKQSDGGTTVRARKLNAVFLQSKR